MLGPALLHSVSYSGSWGQAALSVEEFVDKAADLGFQGVMLMAKRPHLSPLDFDEPARTRLRSRIEKRGLTKVCIAGYNNFTADLEHGEVPHREIQILYVVELARLARDLGAVLVEQLIRRPLGRLRLTQVEQGRDQQEDRKSVV